MMIADLKNAADKWRTKLIEALNLVGFDKKTIKEIELPSTEAYAEAEMDMCLEQGKDWHQISKDKR